MSFWNPKKVKLYCAVLDKITCPLPRVTRDTYKINTPKDLILADECFHIPPDIYIFIGGDIYYIIIILYLFIYYYYL